ncbi:hypothetical protein BVY01_02425 [bacterium I07]|nr:hypothetical protein BVY01_02425 [bacterium I07]
MLPSNISTKTIFSDDKDGKKNFILNIYDNISKNETEALPDWGFSVFIRYQGNTLLYDAGTHPGVLEHNSEVLDADLSSVDFAILSHNHADHINGFDYLLKINPNFKFFLPNEKALGARYNELSDVYTHGYKYRHSNTEYVVGHTEIIKGIHIISTSSPLVGKFWKYPPHDKETKFIQMSELSLAIEDPEGQVCLISGCSHSKIEVIVRTTKSHLKKNVTCVVGGFHHLPYSSDYVTGIAKLMKNELDVERIAPTHCTGEKAIRIFKKLYKDNYYYFGLGTKLPI